MSSSCLSSFSSTRDSFGVFSAGGIANIWGCQGDSGGKLISSTVLPHHLQAVCTCIAWTPFVSLKGSANNELLAYGSSSGAVFLLNALSSSVTALPENGHTGSVSSLTWHPNGTMLYSAADDGFLIEWNTKDNKLVRRWRCPNNDVRGRGGYTALAVSSGSEQKLIAARQQIDVWDLEAGRVAHSFVGHSSDIVTLLPVVCFDKEKDEKSSYILSLAKNDRVMYAWRLDNLSAKPNSDSSSACAAFLLPDSAVSATAYFHADSHTAHIFVVLLNGCAAAYRHVLNGKKVREPVRHSVLIEILSGSNKRLPIFEMSALSSGDVLTLAYGDLSRPQFESFDMKTHWSEKYVKISREIQHTKSDETAANGKQNLVGKFHVATAIPSSSLKVGSKRTLGETLKQAANGTQEVSASSVLAQGLLSRDSRILDSVLGGPGADAVAKRNSENQKHIEAALDSLDNSLLLTLLDELTARLATGHPAASQIAVRWLAVLLRFRGSRLASANTTGGNSVNSAVSAKLAYLRDMLIARTLDFSRVLQLRGRLRMLREMASSTEAKKPAQDWKSTNKTGQATNAETSKSRLPFVLSAADISSGDEGESSEDSDSAMEDVKVKRRKRQPNVMKASSDEESDASSAVELASDGEDDLPDGERDDRLNGSSSNEELEEEEGPTMTNGFNNDDSEDEMNDVGSEGDDGDSSKNKAKKHKSSVANGKLRNQINRKLKSREQKQRASLSGKKSKKQVSA